MDKRLFYPTVMPRKAMKSGVNGEQSTVSGPALVLARNLSVLMAAPEHTDLRSNPKLAKRTGLSTSSVSRLLNGQVDATLDTVAKLAEAFQVEPWQLLVPDIEPDNLPVLLPHTEEERRLWEHVSNLAKEIKRT